MGYVLSNYSWALKSDTVVSTSRSDPSPSTPAPPTLLDSKLLKELLSKVFGMDEKFESLQDLLLSSHCKFDSVEKIWATSKETSADVAKIRLKLE